MRSKDNELGQFATGCPPFDKEVVRADLESGEEEVKTENHMGGASARRSRKRWSRA